MVVFSKQSEQKTNAVNMPILLDKKQPIHFIGIGGVGMSALAKVLLKQGFSVSGSDQAENNYFKACQSLGATVFIGHHAENLPDNALVIYSTAIDEQNPEIQKAQKNNNTIIHRSALLEIIEKQFDTTIALTGTHGKTTMTGMMGSILIEAKKDPTIIAGGKLPQHDSNAVCDSNNHFLVFESDESDGTMARYQPKYLVISNLEFDHPDHYPDGLNSVISAFENYLTSLPRNTRVIFNVACPETFKLYQKYQHHVDSVAVYCGEPKALHFRPEYWLENTTLHAEGGFEAEVWHRVQGCLGKLWLQVPGVHNLHNALLCASVGHLLSIDFPIIRRALENFKGMGRRFDILGKVNDATIVDDYAHHPTEVLATLNAAKEYNQQRGRVIAVFQPHRYQRLNALWTEFLNVFHRADEVIILDIYAASDEPIEAINSERFAAELSSIAGLDSVEYWPGKNYRLMAEQIKKMLTPGDLIITMGAGDITQLSHLLVEKTE